MAQLYGALTGRRETASPIYPHDQRVPYGMRTVAGVPINADSAITIPAAWACIRYLTQTCAVLPWHAMLDEDEGAEIADTHPIDYLLYKRPNPEWSSFQFRETLLHWALRWGNGYAEIEPDQLGRPYNIWPIHPERVLVCRATEDSYSASGDEIPEGSLFYEVNNGTGTPRTVIAASRMFHLRGFGETEVGVNVVSYAAQSLGWTRAAQLFGAAFFGNGMNPSGIITQKKALSPDGLKKLRENLEEVYKGPSRANKTAILDAEMDWKPITFSARDAQLIDVHQFLIDEVCRWFGVPPHKIMHLQRSTFNNIESQAIEVVVDSISPWVKRFEDEADFKLFGNNRAGYYSKMNMRALLRGDHTARAAYYESMVRIGAYSPNRVLELEDENTIGPQGDIHVMQSQNVTLERIAEGPQAPAPAGGPPPPPADGAADPESEYPIGPLDMAADEIAALADIEALIHA